MMPTAAWMISRRDTHRSDYSHILRWVERDSDHPMMA